VACGTGNASIPSGTRRRSSDGWRDANEADDGTSRLPQEYLLSIVRL